MNLRSYKRKARKIAADELDSLAEHMPDISDSDARVLALRMYYIELAEEYRIATPNRKCS